MNRLKISFPLVCIIFLSGCSAIESIKTSDAQDNATKNSVNLINNDDIYPRSLCDKYKSKISYKTTCLYYQALDYPLYKSEQAINPNENMTDDYHWLTEIVDTKILSLDIASLPTELPEDVSIADLNKDFDNPDYWTQDMVTGLLFKLAIAHFQGEYVAKDDLKAVTYLSKLNQFYKKHDPTASEWLYFTFVMSDFDKLSDDNPLKQRTDEEILTSISKLFLTSGNDTIKTMLLTDDFYSLYPDSIHNILPELEKLANEGDYTAIRMLAEIYNELNTVAQDPKYQQKIAEYDIDFATKAEYWQQEADKLPPEETLNWH